MEDISKMCLIKQVYTDAPGGKRGNNRKQQPTGWHQPSTSRAFTLPPVTRPNPEEFLGLDTDDED